MIWNERKTLRNGRQAPKTRVQKSKSQKAKPRIQIPKTKVQNQKPIPQIGRKNPALRLLIFASRLFKNTFSNAEGANTYYMTFSEAVAQSKTLPEKPDNETLLKLYSLYKQATEGDAPEEKSYGMFDFVAKAKHEAWHKHKGTSKADAEARYIALVEELSGK